MVAGCKAEVVSAFKNAGELQLVSPQQTTRDIAKESELFIWVSTWLESHQDGWSSSPASHLPGYIIKGDNFHLNFTETGVVINYKEKNGASRQFTRSIEFVDYQFFMKVAGI